MALSHPRVTWASRPTGHAGLTCHWSRPTGHAGPTGHPLLVTPYWSRDHATAVYGEHPAHRGAPPFGASRPPLPR
eukprot:5174365-Prymnesium_polylepis.1